MSTDEAKFCLDLTDRYARVWKNDIPSIMATEVGQFWCGEESPGMDEPTWLC
jgi:hypothetical protein